MLFKATKVICVFHPFLLPAPSEKPPLPRRMRRKQLAKKMFFYYKRWNRKVNKKFKIKQNIFGAVSDAGIPMPT